MILGGNTKLNETCLPPKREREEDAGPLPPFLFFLLGTRVGCWSGLAESRVGLRGGQVLGRATLVSWAVGKDSTGQTSYSCCGPLVKVMLSVAASVSPEICLGCSVVDEISGSEANPPPPEARAVLCCFW